MSFSPSNIPDDPSSSLPSPHENKRQKTKSSNGTTSTASAPPNYSCQDYWEQRYAKQFLQLNSSNNDTFKNDETTNDTTLPYHSWYFTYDELRPILLPILLGGRKEARMLIDDQNECDEVAVDEEDEIEVNENVDGKEEGENSEEEQRTDDDDDENEHHDDKDLDIVDEDTDDESDEEELVEREGLAESGPVSVLEIGCGDMPLGAALALELKKLEDKTGVTSNSIVTNITCSDYSQVVVQMMQKQFCSSQCLTASSGVEQSSRVTADGSSDVPLTVVNVGKIPLQFVVADARKLPYTDSSFSMVIEKGTLDAMLSDTSTGVADCVKIVAECARVVSRCVVLVSHLNANTASGLSWLDEVIFAGLKQHPDVLWEIEVHGNAEVVANGDSIGPAVYVIHKTPKPVQETESVQGNATIPVKFFCY